MDKLRIFAYTGNRPYSHGDALAAPMSAQEAKQILHRARKRLRPLQERLYAENREAVLAVFQAMDAAGKDSVIRHVFSGLNPQGIDVVSFKQPSDEEMDHDYLWRCFRHLPERGKICVFNRSYYEEVLVGRVHALYRSQSLPERCMYPDLIARRYRQIRDFEQYLWENGIRVVKFYLALSRDEQKRRFLRRLEQPHKNWKFSESDIRERAYWDEYQTAYQDAINATAARNAPWYVIPADDKPTAHAYTAQIMADVLEDIHPQFPAVSPERAALLAQYRAQLELE